MDVVVDEGVGGAGGKAELFDGKIRAVGLGFLGDTWSRNAIENAIFREGGVLVHENRGGFFEGVVRGDRPVGVNRESELLEVGILANTGVLDFVADTKNGGEDGIEGNHIAMKAAGAGFFDGKVTAASLDDEVHLQGVIRVVDVADDLIGVGNFDVGGQFDVASNDAFVASLLASLVGTFDFKGKFDGRVGMALEANVLQVQHNIDDVFANALDGGEFVGRAFDGKGGNSGAFDGRQENATERVAKGVAVAIVKRFDDKLGACRAEFFDFGEVGFANSFCCHSFSPFC